MNSNLAQQAIDNALSGNWDKALNLNLKILQSTPGDVETQIRLAKCYFELGKLPHAKRIINKVLKIDPYNIIANKCYEKWKNIKSLTKRGSKHLSSEMFLEEPGKTKIIHLIHLCDKAIVSQLNCGEVVLANSSGRRISITTESGKYIGKIPDDLSLRLKKLINMGFSYTYAIKSIDNTSIHIFIRESEKPKEYLDVASFSGEKIDYTPYIPPEMLHERDEAPPFGFENEDATNQASIPFSENNDQAPYER